MKNIKKFISIILSVLMLISVFSCSTVVWAEAYNDNVNNKEYIDSLLNSAITTDKEKSPIVCEVEEKRNEFSKTYRRSDGSYTTVVSRVPIHKLDDGQWNEIDNTIEPEGDLLVNSDGTYSIEFPETISETDKITVNNSGENLSFSVNDIESAVAVVDGADNENSNAIVKDLSKTVSSVTYEAIDTQTDVQYIISSDKVKENIIVNDKTGIKDTYSFSIEKGDLTATLDEDNNLKFKNDKNEVVFEIPAPVMTDANNVISYDIGVSVTNADSSVLTLTYTPSRDWLSSSERQYPIIIDPVIIMPDTGDIVVEDTMILNDTNDTTTKNTNYYDSPSGGVMDSGSAHSEILVKLNMNAFSFCADANIVVTDVNYVGAGFVENGNILAKPITGNWDSKTITYADVYPDNGDAGIISYEDEIVDYFTGVAQGSDENFVPVYLNITGLFKEWVSGERANNGFAIVPDGEQTSGAIYLAGDYSANTGTLSFQTYCTVDYVDTSGNGSDYEYINQSIGRAGSANLNVFSRGLSLSRSDVSMPGNVMPVEVTFNYNPAINSFIKFYNDMLEAVGEEAALSLPYGNKWAPSYLQMLFTFNDTQYQFYTGEGTIAVFNLTSETTDGETKYYFEEDSTSSSTGYSLELIDGTSNTDYSNLKIVTPYGYECYFNDCGIVSSIKETEAGYNNVIDRVTISFDENNPYKITTVSDGVGRRYVFNYGTNGLLSGIGCTSADGTPVKAGSTDTNLAVSYTYTGKNLTGVTYADGKSVSYAYDDNGNLVKATNIDDYNIQYSYSSDGKVTEVCEYAGTTSGNKIAFTELAERQIKVADSFNGTQVYQFGNDGKLNYVFDDKGNACKSMYATANDENVYETNEWFTPSQNLLKDGSFEDASSLNSQKPSKWSSDFERVQSATAYDGDYVCKITADNNVEKYIEQTVTVKNVNSYTLSAYVKSETAGMLTLKLKGKRGSSADVAVVTTIEAATDWTRVSVTYTPFKGTSTFNVSELVASIGFENNCGTYYVDAVQLEEGNGTADYNLVANGSFNYGASLDGWTQTNASLAIDNIYGESVNALKLEGGLPYYEDNVLNDYISSATQVVPVDGKKGDVYTVSGWYKGAFDDNYINPDFSLSYAEQAEPLTESIAQIKVTYNYAETVTNEGSAQTTQNIEENFVVSFAPHNDGWQFASDSFALKADVTEISVTVIAQNIIEDSFATDIALTKNDSAVHIDPDDAGTTDDTVTDTTTEECPCENCEEFECDCRCESEAVCSCIQCKRCGNIEAVSEDGKTVTNQSYDGTGYMQSSVQFADDFNYNISEVDSNSIVSNYTYNADGTMASFADGNNNVTAYESNARGYISLAQANVTGLTDNAVKMAVAYSYNGDLLSGIDVGDVDYTYTYDGWGQLTTVSIDGEPIVCYIYDSEVNRARVWKIVFGDTEGEDFTIVYEYCDITGNISSVVKYITIDGEDDAIKYIYEYDNLGNLVSIKDNGTGHRIEYTDTGTQIKDSETNQLIYSIADVTPEVEESSETVDTTNTPISVTEETVGGVVYTHNVFDSVYNQAQGTSTYNEYVTGGKTIGVQGVSDWFGRNKAVSVMTKNPLDDTVTDYAAITSQYAYKTTDGVTSNLISTLSNTITGDEASTVNYTYTYNALGKITGVTSASGITNLSSSSQYVYDEAGQLVEEITGQNSVHYAYDSRGNITSRQKYSGETLVATHTFAYGADGWKDRLTGYNSQAIEYDDIGNPTTYLGASLTWRGRELSKYVKDNKEITYSYDVDGMRYRKVVKTNGVETSRFDYVYSEGRLVVITYTANGVSKTARFVYDSNGEVRGFILDNSATYLYLKNAQGDITAIVDENGAVILTCAYDAWGTVTFGATSMDSMALAAELSKINPFTYRGYCYDYDIEMYYLQSRYYDPKICRFINADSTDYLGATGTLLSYNLYAYCENDAVNCVDQSGCYVDNCAFTIVPGMTIHDIIYYVSLGVQSTGKTGLRVSVGYQPVSGKKYYIYNIGWYSWIKSSSAIYVKYSKFNIYNDRYSSTYFNMKTYNEWLLYVANRHRTVFDEIEDAVLYWLDIDSATWNTFTNDLGNAITLPEFAASLPDWLTLYDFLSVVAKLLKAWFDDVDNYVMYVLEQRPRLKNSTMKIAIMWSVSNYKYGYYNSGTGYRTAWHLSNIYYGWELR